MNRTEASKYQALLDAEIERRISAMEQPDYPFPRRFQKRDCLLWASIAAGCLLLLFLGARLS